MRYAPRHIDLPEAEADRGADGEQLGRQRRHDAPAHDVCDPARHDVKKEALERLGVMQKQRRLEHEDGAAHRSHRRHKRRRRPITRKVREPERRETDEVDPVAEVESVEQQSAVRVVLEPVRHEREAAGRVEEAHGLEAALEDDDDEAHEEQREEPPTGVDAGPSRCGRCGGPLGVRIPGRDRHAARGLTFFRGPHEAGKATAQPFDGPRDPGRRVARATDHEVRDGE
mmetsp:Transcript_22776/g.71391  ORF Transcript_22776/g.71391 Transcript_22776/m.71391 type:complete len:228 (+) Transcript_22776:478-1161(+)